MDNIFDICNLIVESIDSEIAKNKDKCCLFYSMAFQDIVNDYIKLNNLPIRTLMQCGTAFWTTTAEEYDDGVSPNQFGYLCSNEANIIKAIEENRPIPEIHFWNIIVSKDLKTIEIADFTAKFFKTRYEDIFQHFSMYPQS